MAEATNGQTAGLRGNTPSFEYITTKTPVVSGVTAARKINETESGSIILLDNAGVRNTFTLPVAIPGTNYTFITNIGTNTASIITNITSSSPIIVGALNLTANGVTGSMFISNSASGYDTLTFNGTTTGGLQGSKFKVTALSTNTWFIEGTLVGSGTLATPFSKAY